MTDNPVQHYRNLIKEQTELQQQQVSTDKDLLLSAKHPEYYAPDLVISLRIKAEEIWVKINTLIRQREKMENDPDIRPLLDRAYGFPSGSKIWEPQLTSFADIEEKKVPWLWYPYIPLGRLTILEGDPGQGKSWFSLAIATCVSVGGWLEIMPGAENWSQPAGTVYVTCEDDPEDTIKKRLRILQANHALIHHLPGKVKVNTQPMNITLTDLPILSQAIDRTQAKLLIIDPIQAYLPHGTDMNKAEQIRPLLVNLQKLAKAKNVAVLLVRHLSKGSKDQPLYKGMGSIDFTAAARSVLVCAERKELEEWSIPTDGSVPRLLSRRFAVAQVKNNISARGPSVEFSLQHDQFLWVGTSDVDAAQLLAPHTDRQGTATVQDAKKFLVMYLHGESRNAHVLRKDAVRAGIDKPTLDTALQELKVTERRDETGHWIELPEKLRGH